MKRPGGADIRASRGWHPGVAAGKLTRLVASGVLMPTVRVIDRDNVERAVEAPSGATLMEPLRDMDEGVAAICGGMCSCATCHVYVDQEWLARLPPPMSDETDMLGDLNDRRENSRLSCQIVLQDALSGLRVTIAPEE
ncbi:MAG: 2Fe-2S iron-sulfur cluster-binding protein [Steroidobacteraceae bacterium]